MSCVFMAVNRLRDPPNASAIELEIALLYVVFCRMLLRFNVNYELVTHDSSLLFEECGVDNEDYNRDDNWG